MHFCYMSGQINAPEVVQMVDLQSRLLTAVPLADYLWMIWVTNLWVKHPVHYVLVSGIPIG